MRRSHLLFISCTTGGAPLSVTLGGSMNIKARHLWFGSALVAMAGTVFSFMNFWAAVDLGYDTTPHGKTILGGWCLATIGLCLSTLVLAALAVRSWLGQRRSLHLSTER